jgi:muramidase (phage lysozyme)
MARNATLHKNVAAFLDMIAVSEGTAGIGDDGYNVIVGSTKAKPSLFGDYATHPRRLVDLLDKNGKLVCRSTAAGRYQLLARYYDAYRTQLHLPDFSPESQDAIAEKQIREQGAYKDIVNGDIGTAILKCNNIWASFAGAGYGQREHSLETLVEAYVKAGGNLS